MKVEYMWYNLIFILVIFIAVFVGFTGYTLAKDNNSALDQLSEYVNKLEQLPQNPNTWQEPVGAMCYKVAAPPERAEYICPTCGEMTLYPTYASGTLDSIPSYRNLVKKIKKIYVKLDESQFCDKCSPNTKTRDLCLIVKASKDSNPHKTCDITKDDIMLLYEYSEGIKEHDNYYEKVPLANYEARLEELLGVKIKIDKDKK